MRREPSPKAVCMRCYYPDKIAHAAQISITWPCSEAVTPPWSHEPQVWRDSLWCAILLCFVHLSSDRGAQFTSKLWNTVSHAVSQNEAQQDHLVSSTGQWISGTFPSAHNICITGRTCLTGPNWIDELPWVLLGIRTAPKRGPSYIISWLAYSALLTVPRDFVATSDLASRSQIPLRTCSSLSTICSLLHYPALSLATSSHPSTSLLPTSATSSRLSPHTSSIMPTLYLLLLFSLV